MISEQRVLGSAPTASITKIIPTSKTQEHWTLFVSAWVGNFGGTDAQYVDFDLYHTPDAFTWAKGSVSNHLNAMAISPRLDLRQSQSLVMTPQLQQAIKLLQLSNMELAAYVEQELEQNPQLEREEAESAGSQPGADAPSGEPEGDGAIADTRDLTAPDHLPNGDDAPLDADFDNVWTDDGPGESDGALSMWGVRGGRGFDAGDADLEQTVSKDVSLRDYLTEQLMVDIDNPVDRIIGVHLIDMLDEAGYVSGGLAPVAEQLGCSEERVLVTLGKLQSFDPPHHASWPPEAEDSHDDRHPDTRGQGVTGRRA